MVGGPARQVREADPPQKGTLARQMDRMDATRILFRHHIHRTKLPKQQSRKIYYTEIYYVVHCVLIHIMLDELVACIKLA